MSSPEFGWQPLLHTDVPANCALKAALFTTYDRADERLLVEHLLPHFLKLGHEPDSEGTERQYFLLELDRRLKQLHDRIVVVSSMAREEPGDAEENASGTYGWIWRSIRQLTVGSRGRAVQHAKLWMLHWGAGADGVEYLELVISSANLTRAAFRGQLQAGWRACIELHPKRSEERLKRWGMLPAFLRELDRSADEEQRLDPFLELLARGDCPEGVSFVASVPGKYSRQTLRSLPWGAAGLREIVPAGAGRVGVAILSPFAGSWDAIVLGRWCDRFEGSPDRLKLVWIDKHHPWAGKWILPAATLKTLGSDSLLQHRHNSNEANETDLFHEEHRPADDRWCHAKVYSFKRGHSRRLLVTSANFSPAAWGRENADGELTIENFELGVCIEQGLWPFDDLETFDDLQDVATVPQLPVRDGNTISWASAGWDGTTVEVRCRCKVPHGLKGRIQSFGGSTSFSHWEEDPNSRLLLARVAWTDARKQPTSVELTCEQSTVIVAIFDGRPAADRENSLPPEVDEDLAQTMRDELLFELYGGLVASDGLGLTPTASDDDGISDEDGGPGRPDSYDVPAFESARRHLGVVDIWADRVKAVAERTTAEFELGVLRRDGEFLIAAFKRQMDRDGQNGADWKLGAKLAAEELAVRLKHIA